MKNSIIKILHKILGYERYLLLFSKFKIRFLNWDSRKKEFLFFNDYISDDARLVVAGGCTGITSIPFAKNRPKRQIHVFEPEATNYRVLSKVIEYYGHKNIHSSQTGLGDKNEERQFILPVVSGVNKHGVAHVIDETIPEYNKGKLSTVTIQKLDDYCHKKDLHIDAMKIVAENFEFEIFKGASNTILRDRPIIYCELWQNSKRQDVLDYIKSLHYAIYFVRSGELILFDSQNYSGKNFIFKPI